MIKLSAYFTAPVWYYSTCKMANKAGLALLEYLVLLIPCAKGLPVQARFVFILGLRAACVTTARIKLALKYVIVWSMLIIVVCFINSEASRSLRYELSIEIITACANSLFWLAACRLWRAAMIRPGSRGRGIFSHSR